MQSRITTIYKMANRKYPFTKILMVSIHKRNLIIYRV